MNKLIRISSVIAAGAVLCVGGYDVLAAGDNASSKPPAPAAAAKPAATTPAKAVNPAKSDKKELDQKKPTSKLGEKMLKALVDNDAEDFVKLLPGNDGHEFTEKDFKITRKSMTERFGKIIASDFVINLEHPLANVSIWKLRFERDNTDKTRKIHQELLFRVISTKEAPDAPETLIRFDFL